MQFCERAVPLKLYFWFHWVFVAVRAFSVCREPGFFFAAVRGPLVEELLLLRSTGSGCVGLVTAACGLRVVVCYCRASVAVAQGLSCSEACESLPDQGWNSRPLDWQADSSPLCHQGCPACVILYST